MLKYHKKKAVAAPATAKIENTRLRLPLITAAQKTPDTAAAERIHRGAIFPLSKKLLKLIAKYSLRRTATQKIGSEYIRKAKKVIA